MLLSVVLCTHRLDNYHNLIHAIESLLSQTYAHLEIIVVVDGNESLAQRISQAYRGRDRVRIVPTAKKIGVSGARNAGIRVAHGGILAFTDDDVVADSKWIENLVDTHRRFDAAAVGGKILPMWVGTAPDHFPAELGWLVGITYNGFAEEEVCEVRNSFGPNMSYKREVFDRVGVFNEQFGLGARGAIDLQGEEAEFALRMRQSFGRGVTYAPHAVVHHRVPPRKTTPRWMLKRAFYQGYSKALLRRSMGSSDALAVEQAYLSHLLVKYIPRRMKRLLLNSGRVAELKRLGFLAGAVFSAGLGFLCGFARKIP